MNRRNLMTAMGLSTLIFAAATVDAQSGNCAPHADIVAHLAERYAESRQMIGLAANNAVLEVFAADTGSWTVLVTVPGGPSCIVASGENFQLVQDPLPTAGQGA